MYTYQHYLIAEPILFVLELTPFPYLRSSVNDTNKRIILSTQSTVQTSCMSQEEGWAYTQISFLFTSSRKAVGKRLKPQHGSRQERCAINHQDTSHICGKCVTPTLILLTAANTAPDSTRPPTEHSAWSTSDYRKLASGTFNIIHKKNKKKWSKLLCSFFMAWKNLSKCCI